MLPGVNGQNQLSNNLPHNLFLLFSLCPFSHSLSLSLIWPVMLLASGWTFGEHLSPRYDLIPVAHREDWPVFSPAGTTPTHTHRHPHHVLLIVPLYISKSQRALYVVQICVNSMKDNLQQHATHQHKFTWGFQRWLLTITSFD